MAHPLTRHAGHEAALSLPGVDIEARARQRGIALPPDGARQAPLSQWFTPPDLAARFVAWCEVMPEWTVLEPSAGDGALVRPLRKSCRHVEAVEVDPAFSERHGWETGDYLTRPAPATRYDMVVMNPPYEDGVDGRFLAKAMDEATRVVALVRLNVLVGQERYARAWSRVGAEWSLAGVAFLVGRPSFSAAGQATSSPLSDFVAVKLTREMMPTMVEWWA